MKYTNTNDLELEVSHYLQCEKESEAITLEELKEITNRLPSADVVEAESLKTYITNLISNIPQTDYVKDDYDAGFADALRIIYTHLCGERKEAE